MGKKRPHVDAATLLLEWLIRIFGGRCVNSGAPIEVAPEDNPTNEPQPDLIVLRSDYAGFRSATPQPQDLRCWSRSLTPHWLFDLTTKAALYARAAVVEYWVLDVPGRRLIVPRAPHDGQYRLVVAYGSQESVAPLSAPDSPLRAADAFPGSRYSQFKSAYRSPVR